MVEKEREREALNGFNCFLVHLNGHFEGSMAVFVAPLAKP